MDCNIGRTFNMIHRPSLEPIYKIFCIIQHLPIWSPTASLFAKSLDNLKCISLQDDITKTQGSTKLRPFPYIANVHLCCGRVMNVHYHTTSMVTHNDPEPILLIFVIHGGVPVYFNASKGWFLPNFSD